MDKKYVCTVIRTSYASKEITVMAQNEAEARVKALDEAGNHIYNEHNADYEVDGVRSN